MEQFRTGLPQKLFVNRELSWLEFNRRVLAEALNPAVPLLERLKFQAIFYSNLDEFFMVRVGSLTDQHIMDPQRLDSTTGMTPQSQITAILQKVRDFEPMCQKAYHQIRTRLKDVGVDLLDYSSISRADERMASFYFEEELKPLLSPQIIDQHHPFPFLKNKEQYIITQFETKKEGIKLGIVPIGHLPSTMVFDVEGRKKVAFVADVVLYNVQTLYRKYVVQHRNILRVTRNADISVAEGLYDYDVDFRGVMKELLDQRRRLQPVRVQLSMDPGDALLRYLCKKLSITPEHVMVSHSLPLDFSFGFSLPDQLAIDKSQLLFGELRPCISEDLSGRAGLNRVAESDVLLAYPFQSIAPFVDLLYAAAVDPSVVSIKISLYRVSSQSRIAAALCMAAEKGKEVVCILELRARFDEQNNINYADVLENAGCTVLYGLPDYKVHAKLCLITRKVHGKISYITQIGTGNYNEKTAEQYTDLCLITGEEAIGKDAVDTFAALCVGDVSVHPRRLWVAPNSYLTKVLELIDREIAAQREGKDGYIGIKVNSLNNMELMERLVKASQGGVCVELFVRGICCIRPGISGFTDHIKIRSIVGRYLEHSRIFVFGRGERELVFIGSGDLLNRNTIRRVEVFAPVRSPRIKADILHILELERKDDCKAWEMQPDGSYRRVEPAGALDSQMLLFEHFRRPIAGQREKRSFLSRLFSWRFKKGE